MPLTPGNETNVIDCIQNANDNVNVYKHNNALNTPRATVATMLYADKHKWLRCDLSEYRHLGYR